MTISINKINIEHKQRKLFLTALYVIPRKGWHLIIYLRVPDLHRYYLLFTPKNVLEHTVIFRVPLVIIQMFRRVFMGIQLVKFMLCKPSYRAPDYLSVQTDK